MLMVHPAFKELVLDQYLGSELKVLRKKLDEYEINGDPHPALQNDYFARVLLQRHFDNIGQDAQTAKTVLNTLEEQKDGDQGSEGSGSQDPDNGWE